MKILYTYNGIDISYIEFNSTEIDSVINVIADNYPCVSVVTLNITDKKFKLYLYYFSFNGKRAISTSDIYDTYKFVCDNGTDSFEEILNNIKQYIVNYDKNKLCDIR